MEYTIFLDGVEFKFNQQPNTTNLFESMTFKQLKKYCLKAHPLNPKILESVDEYTLEDLAEYTHRFEKFLTFSTALYCLERTTNKFEEQKKLKILLRSFHSYNEPQFTFNCKFSTTSYPQKEIYDISDVEEWIKVDVENIKKDIEYAKNCDSLFEMTI